MTGSKKTSKKSGKGSSRYPSRLREGKSLLTMGQRYLIKTWPNGVWVVR